MTTEQLALGGLPMLLNIKVALRQNGETKSIEHNLELVKIEVEHSQEQMESNPSGNEIAPLKLEAFSSFLEQADLRLLNRGTRNLLLAYLRSTGDRETWFDAYLWELLTLFDFLDELEQTGQDQTP